ncbi:class III signal peptide-containing protein [Thermococcus sp. LS1]|uniref:class III signal peptide-containing protein n=1 Tax=Thermococcus sp. LS1 TaxID=1638259 RepID=UPI001439F6E7|nr:class III signal peptide-containing protein [Thermococcus sp. LS1]NJD99137.1 class III signal peptide-containing protein [Thermococcus sp. LS1]
MRRAQAAVEYLMMMALALVVALFTIRIVQRTAIDASTQVTRTSEEIIKTMNEMMEG